MQIQTFAEASSMLTARNQAARQVLADLEAEGFEVPATIARSQFNDDCIYVFNPATLELIESHGCKSVGARLIEANGAPAGLEWKRGMSAKYLGLWK